ncbi:hypothetical protein JHV675_16210 [Mycobacterium avium subsp. hominissuis]
MSDTKEAQGADAVPRAWLLPTGLRPAIDRPCIATESKPGKFTVQLTVDDLPADAVPLAHDVVQSLVAQRECLLPRPADSTGAGARQHDGGS